MALIRTTQAFNLNDVAAVFPGALTFRGNPGAEGAECEIEGDVPEPALIQAVQNAIIFQSGPTPAALDVRADRPTPPDADGRRPASVRLRAVGPYLAAAAAVTADFIIRWRT